jgi:hypothetical protein
MWCVLILQKVMANYCLAMGEEAGETFCDDNNDYNTTCMHATLRHVSSSFPSLVMLTVAQLQHRVLPGQCIRETILTLKACAF